MFKRVERKRKRREEEEALGLDEDAKEMVGLNDTDSDESDTGSERANVRFNDSNLDSGDDREQDDEDAASEDKSVNEEPPISVADALKNPIYLISLDPTVHGCVLCKGKLIKGVGMATAHKNARVHQRRLEHFKLLSADADPCSNAWELIETVQSATNVQSVESQELSKRALKRQVKQAAICEKRKRHKELKARAMAKKVLTKFPATEATRSPISSKANLQHSPKLRKQPGRFWKRQKLGSKTSTSKTRDVLADSASCTKNPNSGKKLVLKSKEGRLAIIT